jgi:hypothetical protein
MRRWETVHPPRYTTSAITDGPRLTENQGKPVGVVTVMARYSTEIAAVLVGSRPKVSLPVGGRTLAYRRGRYLRTRLRSCSPPPAGIGCPAYPRGRSLGPQAGRGRTVAVKSGAVARLIQLTQTGERSRASHGGRRESEYPDLA